MLVSGLRDVGFIGVTIWAVQNVQIRFLPPGGQRNRPFWGYQQFSAGQSRNIVRYGGILLIGGEELHNHHAYVASSVLQPLVRIQHGLVL